MNKNIAGIRTEYKSRSLEEKDVNASPLEQFSQWLEEALQAGVPEATAMNLATVGANGKPSSRIVLLKGIEKHSFVFYTNYSSKKGTEVAAHEWAALNFFWPELERQIRIEGRIEKISAEESDAYFQSRPYGSRIGAWASDQSRKIASRTELEERMEKLKAMYPEGTLVPRPAYWGGYRLIPEYMEFWQGRPSRLHDRIVYEWKNTVWERYRIAP